MKSKEIRVIYGKEIAAMTRRLLEDYDMASKIEDKDAKIALEPNLVIAATPDTGATTIQSCPPERAASARRRCSNPS